MNDFLNPKSMVTPGIAGATMMLIANAISNQFPEIPFRYSALVMSFIIGGIVFQATIISQKEKYVYWLINSLIIFSVGVGTSNIAKNVGDAQKTEGASLQFLLPFAAAHAQEPPPSTEPTPTTGVQPQQPLTDAQLQELLIKLNQQVVELQKQNTELQIQLQGIQQFNHQLANENNDLRRRKSFFNAW